MQKVTVKKDFVVIGAGLAGMCAAVSAAREGLQVALINDRPVLGGNASSEIGICISGASHQSLNPAIYAKEGGLIEELRNMLHGYNQEDGYGNYACLDAVFFDFIYSEPNITLYLNTTVTDAEMHDQRLVSVTAYHSKSETWFCFEGAYFADCSGDGIVALKAGVPFMQGCEAKEEFQEKNAPDTADKTTMGNTLYFEIENVGHPVQFKRPEFAHDIATMEFMQWMDKPENHRGFDLTGNYWFLELGGELDIIKDSENITLELRKLVFGIWDYVKNSGNFPQSENYILKRVHTIAGIRESRRFNGEYILTEVDIESKVDFDDAVCIGGWPLDIHAPKGIYDSLPAATLYPVTGIYNIPLRCLTAKSIDNLFLAGRNISATHMAFSSTRVMATCACMGQAVGTAAAVCMKDQTMPARLSVKALQKRLIENDQTISGLQDVCNQELQNGWIIKASSTQICENTEATSSKPLTYALGISIPVVTETLDSLRIRVKSTRSTDLNLDILSGEHKNTYLPEKFEKTVTVPIEADYDGWITLPIRAAAGKDGKVHIVLRKNSDIYVYTSETRPIGVITKRYYTEDDRKGYDRDSCPLNPACGYVGQDHRQEPNLCFCALSPAQDLYAPQNVLNAYSRPFGQPNLWVSGKGERHSLDLISLKPKSIQEIQILFDTGLETDGRTAINPECVKDYTLYVDDLRIDITNNYRRLNRHPVKLPAVKHVHIEIHGTHGADTANIYSVRFI